MSAKMPKPHKATLRYGDKGYGSGASGCMFTSVAMVAITAAVPVLMRQALRKGKPIAGA